MKLFYLIFFVANVNICASELPVFPFSNKLQQKIKEETEYFYRMGLISVDSKNDMLEIYKEINEKFSEVGVNEYIKENQSAFKLADMIYDIVIENPRFKLASKEIDTKSDIFISTAREISYDILCRKYKLCFPLEIKDNHVCYVHSPVKFFNANKKAGKNSSVALAGILLTFMPEQEIENNKKKRDEVI